MLGPWSLTITKAIRGEDELTGLLAAAIAPNDRVDEMLEDIKPIKRTTPAGRHALPIPQLATSSEAWVMSFDGSAKPKRAGASCGAVLWRWPTWEAIAAQSWFFEDGTVNEGEYRGRSTV